MGPSLEIPQRKSLFVNGKDPTRTTVNDVHFLRDDDVLLLRFRFDVILQNKENSECTTMVARVIAVPKTSLYLHNLNGVVICTSCIGRFCTSCVAACWSICENSGSSRLPARSTLGRVPCAHRDFSPSGVSPASASRSEIDVNRCTAVRSKHNDVENNKHSSCKW